MLEINDLTIQHTELLFNLTSIRIPKGSFVGIIGANGSGKSTFLNQLIQDSIEFGKVKMENVDFASLNQKTKAKMVTLIDNHFLGLPNLSTREYLQLGRIPYTGLTGILAEEDHRIIHEVALQLNLTSLLSKITTELSDGERQRAGIAKALIQQTPLILLDEPTAFLDYPSKKEIMQQLAELAKSAQKIVLMSSHDLEMCLQYCTHLLVVTPDKKAVFIDEKINFNALEKLAFG